MGLFVAIVTLFCLAVICFLVIYFRGMKTIVISQNMTSTDIIATLDECEYQKKYFKDWIANSLSGCGRVRECISWKPRALMIVAWIRNGDYPDDLS